MNTSQDGINLIKKFEGVRLTAYPDPGTGKAPWTIGYGNTFYENGHSVMKGDTITQARADSLLLLILAKFEAVVYHKITATLKQNQFDALVSFIYNTNGSDTLFRLINSNASSKEIYDFWSTHYITGGGKPLPGLITRRKAEADLYVRN